MKAVLFAAIAVAMCAVVFAQHPRHCDAPWEFEAHAWQADPHNQFFRQGHFAYDAWNERTSIFEEVVNGTDQEYYHDIHLFREHRLYRFNLKTKVCTVQNVDFPFRPIHIPHSSHFIRDAIVGTNAFPNSGVLTTQWEERNATEQFSWFGVFTDREVGCVPVMDHYRNEAYMINLRTEFYDVVLGISDPNIFIPDSSCPHVAMHRQTHHRKPISKRHD
jgi:hypothetical protein